MTRRLTEDEIKKELLDIMDDSRWAGRDFVFMKNLYTGAAGMILEKDERNKSPLTFFDVDIDIEKQNRVLTFDSLENAVRLGWVVD